MMDKLLPCPFCGGEAKLKTARESDGRISYDSIYVACLNCMSTGLSYTTYYSVSSNPEEEAIAAWNRRAQHVPTVDTVEVVRCRDCVHFGECLVTENDYCSKGERKEIWRGGTTDAME